MTTGKPWIRKTVDHLERLNNSRDGNPRYKVYFTDGDVYQTEDNASCNYGIENSEMRSEIEFTVTRAGRIDYMRPAKGNENA